ncbi:MAG: biliverdin-producing heme oxygenase [Leptospiraceae bacterium]|nr:biliverdin-producing heme oxygenase [Leptospiraceae bacterium]MCP5510883.1 biliverdin-producing heme oxygenase [Leptospiraceae bacterium]
MIDSNQNQNLSSLLKDGTSRVHSEIEGSPFMTSFVGGKLHSSDYALYLRNLQAIYESLESKLEELKNHPNLGRFYIPELFRTKALQLDIEYFNKENHNFRITDATREYLNHLDLIYETNVLFLVSHLYVRYLGDLSGGQMLARILRKQFHLEEGVGDHFYRFDIKDIPGFKKNFREILNSLDLNDSEKQNLVEEAIYAFQLNGNLFLSMV